MPVRHQRSRKTGARLPKGVKVVTRPGRWGNPFDTAAQFRNWMERLTDGGPMPALDSAEAKAMAWIASNIGQLTGLDLACWCELNSDCHADVLLEYANHQHHNKGESK